MLKLIETELLKLRRRKLLLIMLLAALIMPFFAMLLFRYKGETGINPLEFYRWSAFGYTLFIILPVVLGILCVMLIYEEKRHDVAKQLWIVPISRMSYFFSKFFVVLFYSVVFMMITAIASAAFGVLPGYIGFDGNHILYLFERCLEIGVITAFALLPVLSIATMTKGYILPSCITLIYALLGFFLMNTNIYLHPICSTAAIIMRDSDIPGLAFSQTINVPFALLCIAAWDIIFILLANIALKKK